MRYPLNAPKSPYVIQGSSPKLPVIEREMRAVVIKNTKKEEVEPVKEVVEEKISIAITPENVEVQQEAQPAKKKKTTKKKAQPKESIQI